MLVSPIKIQGKKTKIMPDILKLLPNMSGKVWIEPFLGSGEVLINVNPDYAVVCDNNEYIINFFKGIQDGTITSEKVREFLEFHGKKLETDGKTYYYEMREKLSVSKDPLTFLFINRSCFNGMIRFNSKGEFNVPFCNKERRFNKSLITKITNQVANIEQVIQSHGKNWIFVCDDWNNIDQYNVFKDKEKVYYFDPPYVERNSTYKDAWDGIKNKKLLDYIETNKSKWILSNWLRSDYRENEIIQAFISSTNCHVYEINHFYQIGGKIENRNPIKECLLTNF